MKDSNWIRIGRLELFWYGWRSIEFGWLWCPAGCAIVSVGLFGFTWLRGNCFEPKEKEK